jgi:fructoselysine 6-kinase
MSQYVVGFGDNVVDYYINHNVKYPGGNAVNFAVNARKSGVKSYYVGSISSDTDGEFLRQSIVAEEVDISYCDNASGPTEQAHVIIKSGDREFVDGVRGRRETPTLTKELVELLKNSALVHTSCHSRTEEKIKELKKLGVKLSFDFSDVEKYRTDDYLNLVCPSIYMAQFSVAGNDEVEINRLVSICHSLKVPYLLLTRGNKSPIFIDNKKNKTYQGFIRKIDSPHDTMGAGDAYFAAFASHFVLGSEDRTDEEHIINSFQNGADIAYQTLMVDGSFGHGRKIAD